MPVVDTTQSFSTGDTVTSTTLNNIMDQSIFVAGAIVSGSGLSITTGGQMTIADNGVSGAKITNGTITTEKIADSIITTAKLANGAVTSAKLEKPFTVATSQATTSGTSVTFGSIPSWVKKIDLVFRSVSTNGSSILIARIGDSGGIETSGYNGFLSYIATTVGTAAETSGVPFGGGSASSSYNGILTICNLSGNTWVFAGNGNDEFGSSSLFSGEKTLSGVLTQIQITSISGDTFDGGSVNIMYS